MLRCRVVVVAKLKNCRVPTSARICIVSTGWIRLGESDPQLWSNVGQTVFQIQGGSEPFATNLILDGRNIKGIWL